MLTDTPLSSWRRRTRVWLFVLAAFLITLTALLVATARSPSRYRTPVLPLVLLAQMSVIPPVPHSVRVSADPSDHPAEKVPEDSPESEWSFTPVFCVNSVPTSLSTLAEGQFVGADDAQIRLFGCPSQEAIHQT